MSKSKGKSKTDAVEKRDLSAAGIVKLAELFKLKLFHSPLREPFATFWVKDHLETWPIKGEEFGMWLCGICHHQYGSVPSQKALAEARHTVAANALFASQEQRTYVRIAGHDGKIYLDLCNDSWEVVRISTDGWDIVSHVPIKFVRTPGMQALPCPLDGGCIGLLRPFLNVEGEDQWRLAVAFLIGALRPSGPFSLLVLGGTHDAKAPIVASFVGQGITFKSMGRLVLDEEKASLWLVTTGTEPKMVLSLSLRLAVPTESFETLLDAPEEVRWKLSFFAVEAFRLPCGTLDLREMAVDE